LKKAILKKKLAFLNNEVMSILNNEVKIIWLMNIPSLSLFAINMQRMPQPHKPRKLYNPPKMKGFKPFGIELRNTLQVIMHELEILNINNKFN